MPYMLDHISKEHASHVTRTVNLDHDGRSDPV